jgi:hypothetical protein
MWRHGPNRPRAASGIAGVVGDGTNVWLLVSGWRASPASLGEAARLPLLMRYNTRTGALERFAPPADPGNYPSAPRPAGGGGRGLARDLDGRAPLRQARGDWSQLATPVGTPLPSFNQVFRRDGAVWFLGPTALLRRAGK